jgi:hypothetical protein
LTEESGVLHLRYHVIARNATPFQEGRHMATKATWEMGFEEAVRLAAEELEAGQD